MRKKVYQANDSFKHSLQKQMFKKVILLIDVRLLIILCLGFYYQVPMLSHECFDFDTYRSYKINGRKALYLSSVAQNM